MAQITAGVHGVDEVELERIRGEWLRSAVPVMVSVLALIGVMLAGAYAARTFVGLGAMFLAG
jgi:hypothetical protein